MWSIPIEKEKKKNGDDDTDNNDGEDGTYLLRPSEHSVKFTFTYPGFLNTPQSHVFNLSLWSYELDPSLRDQKHIMPSSACLRRVQIPAALTKQKVTEVSAPPSIASEKQESEATIKAKAEFVKQWPCKHLFF